MPGELLRGFENQDKSGTGYDCTVTRFGATKVGLDISGEVQTKKRITYDANGNIEYVGFAAPGTATSAASWMIMKLTWALSPVFYETTQVDFADGVSTYTKIWDNRATYTYS